MSLKSITIKSLNFTWVILRPHYCILMPKITCICNQHRIFLLYRNNTKTNKTKLQLSINGAEPYLSTERCRFNPSIIWKEMDAGVHRSPYFKKRRKKKSDYRFAFHCISSIVLNNGCTKLEPSTCICFTSSSSIRTCCELLGHNWINLIEHFFFRIVSH